MYPKEQYIDTQPTCEPTTSMLELPEIILRKWYSQLNSNQPVTAQMFSLLRLDFPLVPPALFNKCLSLMTSPMDFEQVYMVSILSFAAFYTAHETALQNRAPQPISHYTYNTHIYTNIFKFTYAISYTLQQFFNFNQSKP
ncbi:Hypothetical_protein [Hexamita inflata]|uniref:Hypothetical_protein n=1 Tax=Hexamita inflata TaxID=28002 RepID=A0AA86TXF7_9EUKA|nr:Hypothetical protein HINF_LOCUS18302 [Hexamita inflata]